METTKMKMKEAVELLMGDLTRVEEFKESLLKLYRHYSMCYIRLDSNETDLEPTFDSKAASDDMFFIEQMIWAVEDSEKKD